MTTPGTWLMGVAFGSVMVAMVCSFALNGQTEAMLAVWHCAAVVFWVFVFAALVYETVARRRK